MSYKNNTTPKDINGMFSYHRKKPSKSTFRFRGKSSERKTNHRAKRHKEINDGKRAKTSTLYFSPRLLHPSCGLLADIHSGAFSNSIAHSFAALWFDCCSLWDAINNGGINFSLIAAQIPQYIQKKQLSWLATTTNDIWINGARPQNARERN